MKYRKNKNPEAVSHNYWCKQRSGKNEEEPFQVAIYQNFAVWE